MRRRCKALIQPLIHVEGMVNLSAGLLCGGCMSGTLSAHQMSVDRKTQPGDRMGE